LSDRFVTGRVSRDAWCSVTPSLEFIRLSVYSKSSEGVLAARLAFSGVAWEGVTD